MLNKFCICVCIFALAIHSLSKLTYKAIHFKSVAFASTSMSRLKHQSSTSSVEVL